MKDYYEILGVEAEASEEEIRARWIELTKRYHPDLGETEGGGERIREINEAYEVLKDEPARFHYDFERDLKRSFVKKEAHRDQERRANIRKRVILPCSGMVVLFFVVGFFLLRPGRVSAPQKTDALHKSDKGSGKMIALQAPPVKTHSKAREESRAPKEIEEVARPPESKKVAMLSLQPFSSGVEHPSPPAEKESEAKKTPVPQVAMRSENPATGEVSKEIPKEIPKPVAKEAPGEISKEPLAVAPKEVPEEALKEVPKEVPKEAPREIQKEAPKEVAKEVVKEVPKEVTQQVPKEVSKEIPKPLVKEAPREVPTIVAKEVPGEVPKDPPKEDTRVTLHPGRKLTMWAKEEKTVLYRPSPFVREEEVKQFFSGYVDRYNRKDVNGFLSFFSSKAIQNQTEGLKTIGALYTRLADQSEELRYQIEGMKIDIYQNRVDVKARFRVDQRLKMNGGEKVWKGNIRWVLVKEEGRLKIIALDY